MKKLFQVFAMLAALVFVPVTFADTKAGDGYQFKQVKGNAVASMRSSAIAPLKPTNIFILNISNYSIHASVPGTTVGFRIDPGFTGIITNDFYSSPTFVRLTDYNGQVFFDQSVCRYAIVTADYPGRWRGIVDPRFC